MSALYRVITRTYLEMRQRSEFSPVQNGDARIRIEKIGNCPTSFFRYLYREVGRNYDWVDRLDWTGEEIQQYMAQSSVVLWLMCFDGSPTGYFELAAQNDCSVQIVHLGLLPEFIGRGLGKHLLSRAIEEAWSMGASRVWLHTSTLDDPAAMPNYLKFGFKPFKTETYAALASPPLGTGVEVI